MHSYDYFSSRMPIWRRMCWVSGCQARRETGPGYGALASEMLPFPFVRAARAPLAWWLAALSSLGGLGVWLALGWTHGRPPAPAVWCSLVEALPPAPPLAPPSPVEIPSPPAEPAPPSSPPSSSPPSSSPSSSPSAAGASGRCDGGETKDEATGLPLPPGDAPAVYQAWLAAQPPAMRAKLMRFCRRESPTDFHCACGGIGPLHVPPPPALLPEGGLEKHEQWQRRLSREQRRYYERQCGDEENAYSELCGGTPLVVSFDGRAVEFQPGTRFAFVAGDPVAMDWPSPATPWIARDLDGDGVITHGGELFGSRTELADGSLARHGFAALAPLDTDGNGQLDAADPAFAQLVLWADFDRDGRGAGAELRPLAEVVTAISLRYERTPRCDARGNCQREHAALSWRDERGAHQGQVIDVYLRF